MTECVCFLLQGGATFQQAAVEVASDDIELQERIEEDVSQSTHMYSSSCPEIE